MSERQRRIYQTPEQYVADRQIAAMEGWRVAAETPTPTGLVVHYQRARPGDALRRGLGIIVAGLIVLAVGAVVLQSLGIGNPNSASRGGAPFVAPTPVAFQPAYDNALKHVSYSDLFHKLESYFGESIYFRGRVLQVLDDQLRITYGDDAFGSDDVYLFDYSGPRVIEDDVLDVVARPLRVLDYETIFGAHRQIPALTVVVTKYIRHE